MERRKAIKNLGMSMGAIVATPSIISLLQSCQAQEAPWVPTFFSEDQGVFVRRMVDAILPASGSLPSASEVNAHVFIDKFAKEVISVDDKPNAREGVEIAMQALMKDAGAKTIRDVEEESYIAFLTKHLKRSKAEADETMGKVWAHMGDNNNSIRGMAEDLVVYQYLYQLRETAIWAYRTNEVVGETIMPYKPIPGEQRGCVDLQQTTGGLAFSPSY